MSPLRFEDVSPVLLKTEKGPAALGLRGNGDVALSLVC